MGPAKQMKQNQPESIGVCWMEEDGTIVLKLIASGPDGLIGHGTLSYGREHEQYQEILQHVGPLKPGQNKPVSPWPD